MANYTSILAVMTDTESGRAPLETALRLGRKFGCRVDVLHVRADASSALPLVGEAMSGAMVDEMIAVADREGAERAARVRSLVETLCERDETPLVDPESDVDGLSVAWLEDFGAEDQVVAMRAARSDLTVLARPNESHAAIGLLTLNAALMQSGRPVVAAPPMTEAQLADSEKPISGFIRKICIFWNGSVHVVRAITASLPFLAQADEVSILTVDEEEWFAPADDVQLYLKRHGIQAQLHQTGPVEGDEGTCLLERAERLDADMLIMGAYTRSKVRRIILGSVTSTVIEDAPIPVFLCH